MPRNVCLVSGSGGHHEQLKRLGKMLEYKYKIYQIAEESNLIYEGLKLREIMEKTTGKAIAARTAVSYIFRCMFFLKKRKIDCVISLGPAVSVLVALACRLLMIKFVHIESWSRFYQLSLTSRIIMRLGYQVWVQNKELLEAYPGKSIVYIGRL